jgi:hypothetical protein
LEFVMRLGVVLVAVLSLALPVGMSLGAPTAQQRAEIQAISTLLTKAGNLYKESKFKEAGEAVKGVQNRLEKGSRRGGPANLQPAGADS